MNYHGDLLYYDANNYDEFLLDYVDGVNGVCQIIKRVGYNADGTTYVLATPQTINYTPYPLIHLTTGDYTITLPGYNQGYLFVRLMASNIYTSEFATRVEMNSAISQTAQNINLSVDQKLTNYSTTTQMNSAIDMKANQITSTVSSTYATKTALTTAVSTINQTTDSISATVSQKLDSGEFTQANIIAEINDGVSQVKINAQNINLSGYLTISSASSTYASKSSLSAGTTIINGACITTGIIKSSNYEAGVSGTAINLTNGVISSKNFTINSSGNVSVTGSITSSNVTLTGGTIKSGNYVSGTSGTLINLSNGSIDSKNFKVSSTGALTASNATISGNITATSGTIGGCTIRDGTLYVDNANINSINGSKISNSSIIGDKISSVYPSSFTSGTVGVNNFVIETDSGFIKCGYGVDHPYVSALNVGYGSGGISFRNGTSVGNVGSQIGNIFMDISSGSNVMYLDAGGGINLCSGTLKVIPGEEIRATAVRANHLWIGDHVINDDLGAQISMDYNLDLWSAQGYHVRANGVQVGGSNSTLNIKQNVKERDTSNVLNILKDIKLYDYNYIPEFYGGEKSYGYIIDYLEQIPELKEYVHFVNIDRNPDYPTKVVENQEEWIKFLLACVIELNKKLEENNGRCNNKNK